MKRLIWVLLIGSAFGQMYPYYPPAATASGTITPAMITGKSNVTGQTNALGTNGGSGCATDIYCIFLPPGPGGVAGSLAGNSLRLIVEFTSSDTITSVTTDKSQTFTNVLTSLAESSKKVAVYILPCATTGTTEAKILASGGTIYQAQWQQIAGLPCSSTVDVSTSNVGVSGTTFTAGSFTPTTGDLVAYTACRAGTPKPTTNTFTPGTQTGLSWVFFAVDTYSGCMTQWALYTGSGAINPQAVSGGASTFIATAEAYHVSSSQGTNPTGMYVGEATEVYTALNPAAGGNFSWQIPSVGNTELIQVSCSGYNPTAITDSVNSAWRVLGPNAALNGAIADNAMVVQNAAANGNGAISATFIVANTSASGDCDGYAYDIIGAGSTVSLANRMQVSGDQTVAGALSFLTNYVPGANAGLSFGTISQQANTAIGITAPSGASIQTAFYGGQSNDGPSLPMQNNCFGIFPNTSAAGQTWTCTFNTAAEAVGLYTGEVVEIAAPGATLGPYSPQSCSAATVSSNKLTCTLVPQASSYVLHAVMFWNNTSATVSCSDPINGTWTAIDSPVNGTAGTLGSERAQAFYVHGTSTSSTVITCTASASITTGPSWLGVQEGDHVTTLDQHPAIATSNSHATPAPCTTSGTTATANEWIPSAIIVGTSMSGVPTQFTAKQVYFAGTFGEAVGDLVVNATGTYQAQWPLDTTPDAYMCVEDSFQ